MAQEVTAPLGLDQRAVKPDTILLKASSTHNYVLRRPPIEPEREPLGLRTDTNVAAQDYPPR